MGIVGIWNTIGKAVSKAAGWAAEHPDAAAKIGVDIFGGISEAREKKNNAKTLEEYKVAAEEESKQLQLALQKIEQQLVEVQETYENNLQALISESEQSQLVADEKFLGIQKTREIDLQAMNTKINDLKEKIDGDMIAAQSYMQTLQSDLEQVKNHLLTYQQKASRGFWLYGIVGGGVAVILGILIIVL